MNVNPEAQERMYALRDEYDRLEAEINILDAQQEQVMEKMWELFYANPTICFRRPK